MKMTSKVKTRYSRLTISLITAMVLHFALTASVLAQKTDQSKAKQPNPELMAPGGGNFIHNQNEAPQTADFNISGNGTAGGVFSSWDANVTRQYNIGGRRILGVAGTNNLFVGLFSGFSNTSGSRNTFLGSNAGFRNTVGSSNVFIGDYSGLDNTTGLNNSFVGISAGESNTTGLNNSFVGRNSGISNTTGTNNSAIGYAANFASGDLNYATSIGAGSTVSSSNTIALGRNTGDDVVVVYGLGTAGSTALCRNASNEISGCSSSLRYKRNVSDFSQGLAFINKLRPIAFDWKTDGTHDVGFGAEDLARIDPRFVTYNQKGEVEGVKYDRITTALVNAAKEQQALIDRQRKEIDELRAIVCTFKPDAKLCNR